MEETPVTKPFDLPGETQVFMQMDQVVLDELCKKIRGAGAIDAYTTLDHVSLAASDRMGEPVTRAYVAGILWEAINDEQLNIDKDGWVTLGVNAPAAD